MADDNTDSSKASTLKLVNSSFWRKIYSMMLEIFPLELVSDFFNRVPIESPEINMRGLELIHHIWQENSQIPQKWEYDLFQKLIEFLLAKGQHNSSVFLNRFLKENLESALFKSISFIRALYPHFSNFLPKSDLRSHLIKLLVNSERMFNSSEIVTVIKRAEKRGWIYVHLLHITDKSYKKCKNLNYEVSILPQILTAPGILALPHFAGASMICDIRQPHMIVRKKKFEFKSNKLFIEGNELGRRSTFHLFCHENKINCLKYNPPDKEVVIIEKDLFCKRRKRVVLHANCCYGAPLYLVNIHFNKLIFQNNSQPIQLFNNTLYEQFLFPEEIKSRHRQLLFQMEEQKYIVKYDSTSERISINDTYLIKGVPANILYHLLEAYENTKKTVFSHKDLMMDPKIHKYMKNPNLWVQVNRLSNRLKSNFNHIAISYLNKGIFHVVYNCDLVLKKIIKTPEVINQL